MTFHVVPCRFEVRLIYLKNTPHNRIWAIVLTNSRALGARTRHLTFYALTCHICDIRSRFTNSRLHFFSRGIRLPGVRYHRRISFERHERIRSACRDRSQRQKLPAFPGRQVRCTRLVYSARDLFAPVGLRVIYIYRQNSRDNLEYVFSRVSLVSSGLDPI